MVFQLFSFHPRIFVYTCFSTLRAWNKLDNKRKDARRMRGKLVRKGGQRDEFGHPKTRLSILFFSSNNRANHEDVNLFGVNNIQKCIIVL